MTTEKQAEANRRNASKSSGPKTDEGKAASRLNALRHGLRARTVVQPGDDQSEFDQLSADLQEACDPQNRPEELLVEKMVIAEWQLARLQRAESILLLEQQGTTRAHLHPRLQGAPVYRQNETAEPGGPAQRNYRQMGGLVSPSAGERY